GQRARVIDSQERAQRALVGTIEASIRAVERAEEEMEKPVQIELPRFTDDPTSRRWVETKVEVEKQKVVQLTAVPDEIDSRVGTAIATIGSNLPEMGRGVRELAALMPDERRAGGMLFAS
uniref:Talin central domain-containing protein n=1 Tax=Parascaris equorum TaxID=6256 RepID=A0A914S7E8_PAREQ